MMLMLRLDDRRASALRVAAEALERTREELVREALDYYLAIDEPVSGQDPGTLAS